MRVGFLLVCSLAFVFVCAPGVWAKVQRVESTQIGPWQIEAFAGDPDEYASCSIATANEDGVQFGVWADRLVGWRLWLGADSWQLKEGTEYDVRYTVDDQAPVAAKALAVVDNSVHIPLGHGFEATDVLRKGNRISIQTAQQTFSFDLSGSARALDGMRDCARKWLGQRDASADPFSKTPPGDVTSSLPSDPEIPQRMPGSLKDFFKPANVGPWRIDATNDFLYHAFTYCSAKPPDAGGYSLFIRLDRRLDWSIDVLNAAWQLKPGIPLVLRYSIDGAPSVKTEGKVIIAQSTTIMLGKEPALIDALRRGRRFSFHVNGEDFTFDLTGADRAMDATVKCVKYYVTEG
jgi:hypothetical protein